jgi:hypothetical protein
VRSTSFEEPSDALWAGCIKVPKAGRLCEHTVQSITHNNEPAYFEVLDLTSDDRFNALPFVTHAPHFKYYCGVPLRTKKGIPIGSLFALDDKVRDPISPSNIHFLTIMAENVMAHYENQKEKEDRKRVLQMNMCLAAFVDPEHQVRKSKRKTPSQRSAGAASFRSQNKSSPLQDSFGNKAEAQTSPEGRKTATSNESQHSSGSVGVSESESESTSTRYRVEEDDHIQTFKRAADLLHTSLSLESGGGVLFLDTATPYRSVREALIPQ